MADCFGRDVDRSLERIEAIVGRARSRGARLVVLPESAVGGYLYEPKVPGIIDLVAPVPALERDGPHLEKLRRIAGETVVCVGYTEEALGGGVYSSAICLSGDGVLGHHRKVHIPPAERGVFLSGGDFEAFDTPVGRLGMLLCYDKVFPEAARKLSLDGAEIIASMAAWPACREANTRRLGRDVQTQHFNILDQARAVENQVVWVSANQVGKLGRLRFPGQAKVVSPDGNVLANTHSRRGVAVANVDTQAALSTERTRISHLGDRRPQAYAAVAHGAQPERRSAEHRTVRSRASTARSGL
ncbi:MAG: carbon-nitrogen hydrolase family protein [Actinomycetota bacterium]|nr:carbon-nitrogen hydrolase family protein [Actinomycetota bacterium]